MEPFPGESTESFALGDLSFDYARCGVTLTGEPADLTATEYAVLYQLAVQALRVLTHGLMIQRLWGPERVGEGWLLRNVVKVLRRKLGEDTASPRYTITEPRAGYRIASEEGDTLDQTDSDGTPRGGR